MNLESAKKIVIASGNTFQAKVAEYFRQTDWAVMVSPYYVDSLTNKSRELDLIVEKSEGFRLPSAMFAPLSRRVRFFIECKFISQDTVFWFDVFDEERARRLVMERTGLDRNDRAVNSHHYLRAPDGQVAKLFATGQQAGEENDAFFKAINQSLNGYLSNKTRESLVSQVSGEKIRFVDYPIIVCSDFDRFARIDISDSSKEPTAVLSPFMLEVNYAYLNKMQTSARDYFLIDVVEYKQLPDFIKSLKTELDGVMRSAVEKHMRDNR